MAQSLRHLMFSFRWESEHVVLSSRTGIQDILQWDSGIVGLSLHQPL